MRGSQASFKLINAYDSHVHWQGTGAFASRLDLSDMKSVNDVAKLKPGQRHFRGDWLLGFGWDENCWKEKKKPHRKDIDLAYANQPVKFVRADGHSAWVNTEALKRAGLFCENPQQPDGGRIELDEEGWPTGILIDMAMKPVNQLIPKPNAAEVKADLIAGASIFNQAGFTHIRDMTCDETEWQAKCELAESGELTLAVEQNFNANDPNDFQKALELAVRAQKGCPPLLRPLGTKVFLDGALGSEGAYLSQPYPSGGKGVILIERIALKEMIRETWSNGLDIAVHSIGDAAAHLVCTVAHELWEMGEQGRLHIEHSEMLRPESIEKITDQDAVCHIQPCHWLTDKIWLKEKTGSLFSSVFPWGMLEEAGVRFYFGSDSPVEKPSVWKNIEAVEDAAKGGVRALKAEPQLHQQHLDLQWVPDTHTEFHDGQVAGLVFRGNKLI